MLQELNGGYVKTETHQGITTIEFFHPKGNSLPYKLADVLAKEIHFAGTHDDTKVIIVKSAGDKTFCAGASFDELAELKTEGEANEYFSTFAHIINAIRKSTKFVIGRIQGKCVGGGVGLAAAFDYAIALQSADIRLSELEMGIGPFVIGTAVERKIGIAAFSALSIDATMWRNSDWAKRKGMFAEIHETAENMDESIFRLANHLSRSNPAAMAEMKKMLWRGTEHWDTLLQERATISGKLAVGSFTKKAIEKFREKA